MNKANELDEKRGRDEHKDERWSEMNLSLEEMLPGPSVWVCLYVI